MNVRVIRISMTFYQQFLQILKRIFRFSKICKLYIKNKQFKQSQQIKDSMPQNCFLDLSQNHCYDIFYLQSILMLKPKTHLFKVKVMLNKLEAVNNKVASRCHASLKIQNEEISFKISPELKKNIAVFNSQVEYQNYSIYYDELTGLYENKSATLLLEIQTQGTKVKIGQVQINLGSILNEKKYRIVNTFPLSKCYDKTAKVKLSVDFIPLTAPAEPLAQKREKRQFTLRENISNDSQRMNIPNTPSGNNWKQNNFKSRLAEESNYILQEKIYQYEQKMDNYRLSQTQLQEKLHEQVSAKDELISELTMQLNRKSQQISMLNLQNEQHKFRIKQLNEELSAIKNTNKQLFIRIQNHQRQQETIKKQYQSLRASLENVSKTKDNKQKYFTQELAKYTQRYLESEQERNKIIFQLETKFKQQMEKKQNGYRALISNSDKKYTQNLNSLKQRIKILEKQGIQKGEMIQQYLQESKKLQQVILLKGKQIADFRQKLEESNAANEKLQRSYNNQFNQLQTLNFSYQQLEREQSHVKEQLNLHKKSSEQLKMELLMANQTIQQQRKSLTKYGKELQVHQQRQYYLTQRYQQQLEIKSYHEENMRGQSIYYRDQYYKLKNQFKISQERADDEANKNQQLSEAINRVQIELANKNQILMRIGQEKLMLQTQNRSLKQELSEIQQALMILKQQNMQLGDQLRDKKIAIDSDRSLQWSYKIEQLQRDISEMVEKFKIEKDLLKENFRKEEIKKKEEIILLNNFLKKSKQETQELKRTFARKQAKLRQYDHSNDELKYALKEKIQQISDLKEKIRIYMAQIQELQIKMKQLQGTHAIKIREIEDKYQRQQKSLKKLDTFKNGVNKVISNILQFINKPLSSAILYQEISSTQLDQEICNMINFSLKKFSDQRLKNKEALKRLQNQAQNSRAEPKTSQFISKYTQKRISNIGIEVNDSFSVKRANLGRETQIGYNHWKPGHKTSEKDNYELQQIRDENSRLKREISQLRVKLKNLDDEVAKAQRNADNERYAKQSIKKEIEDLQDQIEKINFQLKRKQKIITQYQNEMREMQTEIMTNKNIQANIGTKSNTLSRSQIKMRQKQQMAISNRNSIVIRDLQSKLQSKQKQIDELNGEINRLKTESTTHKQSINNLKSEIRVYQAKLKERTSKLLAQQQQLNKIKASYDEQYKRQFSKQHQTIIQMEQSISALQEQCKKAQNAIISLQKQKQNLQKKNKMAKQELRLLQAKNKRQNQQSQARLKEAVQQKQQEIMSLKSDLQQTNFKLKELTTKNASNNALLSKKNEQIEKQIIQINSKTNQILHLQESSQQKCIQYENQIKNLIEKIQQMESNYTQKQYQLQQYRFTAEGKLIDLQKRLEEAMQSYSQKR